MVHKRCTITEALTNLRNGGWNINTGEMGAAGESAVADLGYPFRQYNCSLAFAFAEHIITYGIVA